MKRLNFKTEIKAPKEAVWQTLWDDVGYRQWTSAFCEGSYAETDNWKEGTEVKFLDPSGSGVVSRVAENRPYSFMSFEHLGEVNKGVEDRTGEKVKAWVGARENYTLREIAGGTELSIETDMADDYVNMFMRMWPKALDEIKSLAEQSRKPHKMATKIFLNLPVRDLKKSMDFFESLGYSFNQQFTDDTAACMVIAEDIYAMLLTHEKFAQFTPKKIADATQTSEVLICLSCESKDAVNSLLEKALAAGAVEARDPQDYGFMFGRSFSDLDGHIWEIMWMDAAAVQQPQVAEAQMQ